MVEPSTEEVVRAYLTAAQSGDLDRLSQLRHPEWTEELPQSGELVRGDANERAIAEHYPGGLPTLDRIRIVGSEDRWVVTPSSTVQRVVGSGDSWWADVKVVYRDGSTWFAAKLFELRDATIYRETTYWAEAFEAPAWRARWVERLG